MIRIGCIFLAFLLCVAGIFPQQDKYAYAQGPEDDWDTSIPLRYQHPIEYQVLPESSLTTAYLASLVVQTPYNVNYSAFRTRTDAQVPVPATTYVHLFYNGTNFRYRKNDGTYTDVGAGGGGSGTINAGVANAIPFYAGAGTTIDDTVLFIGGDATNPELEFALANSASSFGIRRNGTTAQFRLGDNSADAPMSAAAGTFSGDLTLSNTASFYGWTDARFYRYGVGDVGLTGAGGGSAQWRIFENDGGTIGTFDANDSVFTVSFSSSQAVLGTSNVGAGNNNSIRINSDGTEIVFSFDNSDEMTLNTSTLLPGSDGGNSLGSTTTSWQNLFLNSTAVIGFEGSDVTITHATNALAFAGAANGYSFDDDILLPTAGTVINWGGSDILLTQASNTLTWSGAANLGYVFNDAFVSQKGQLIATLYPQGANLPATAFATLDTRLGGSTPAEVVSVLDFDTTTQEYADWVITLPANYGARGLTITIVGSMTSATAEEVVLGAAIRRMEVDAEDIDAAHTYDFNNSASTVVANVSGEVFVITITFTSGADMDSLAAGESGIFRLTRVVGDAGDDAAGDFEFWRAYVRET